MKPERVRCGCLCIGSAEEDDEIAGADRCGDRQPPRFEERPEGCCYLRGTAKDDGAAGGRDSGENQA